MSSCRVDFKFVTELNTFFFSCTTCRGQRNWAYVSVCFYNQTKKKITENEKKNVSIPHTFFSVFIEFHSHSLNFLLRSWVPNHTSNRPFIINAYVLRQIGTDMDCVSLILGANNSSSGDYFLFFMSAWRNQKILFLYLLWIYVKGKRLRIFLVFQKVSWENFFFRSGAATLSAEGPSSLSTVCRKFKIAVNKKSLLIY